MPTQEADQGQESLSISPLPGLAYSFYSNSHYKSEVRVPHMQGICAGQWTLLACHERPKHGDGTAVVRLGFVTARSRDAELVVLSPKPSSPKSIVLVRTCKLRISRLSGLLLWPRLRVL